MKELVEYIVKQIVSVPDAVSVSEDVSGSVINLSLKVADEDMGIVIGKKGQTIRSIRTLLIVRAMNDGVRVNLTLIDVQPQTEEQVGPSTDGEKENEDGLPASPELQRGEPLTADREQLAENSEKNLGDNLSGEVEEGEQEKSEEESEVQTEPEAVEENGPSEKSAPEENKA